AAIMEHLLRGTGREIGLGAITEIKVYEHRGVRLVGPLPAPIQNYTTYVAGVLAASPSGEAAAAFIRFVTNPQARADFAAAGVEGRGAAVRGAAPRGLPGRARSRRRRAGRWARPPPS